MRDKKHKQKLKSWKRDQRFKEADARDFRLVFYALIVGLIAGTFGSVFRLSLGYIDRYRDHLFATALLEGRTGWLWPILFSVAGIGIALFLVKRFAPEASGSGVQEIEGALDEIRPVRWKRVLPIKFISSLFSLGSGLLLGREGPTIQIGANVGKMVKDVFRQPHSKDNPLISAGAAAGLASAFNAPLSGVVFIIEEMHGHFRYTFFTVAAIMVASGSADLLVRLLVGSDPVIRMTIYPAPESESLWMFVLLGVLFSFVGMAFNRLLIVSLDLFRDLSRITLILSAVIAGIIIAITGIIYPQLIGGGYETIRSVLDHSPSVKVLALFFLARMVLTLFSYGTGAPGGIFAPLLALGVIFGMLFGQVMQDFFPEVVNHPGVFAVAGMAGIFASTVRAPLTGLILAVEMTSNFELILPLIITSITASLFTARLGNEPIYTTLLERTVRADTAK